MLTQRDADSDHPGAVRSRRSVPLRVSSGVQRSGAQAADARLGWERIPVGSTPVGFDPQRCSTEGSGVYGARFTLVKWRSGAVT